MTELSQRNSNKMYTVDELPAALDTLRASGRKIVHCHGVFDLLHVGHIRYFEQAKKLGMAYQISGVPVMIVNGKYRFDLGSAGGPERTLQVADFLIEKERSAQ